MVETVSIRNPGWWLHQITHNTEFPCYGSLYRAQRDWVSLSAYYKQIQTKTRAAGLPQPPQQWLTYLQFASKQQRTLTAIWRKSWGKLTPVLTILCFTQTPPGQFSTLLFKPWSAGIHLFRIHFNHSTSQVLRQERGNLLKSSESAVKSLP